MKITSLLFLLLTTIASCKDPELRNVDSKKVNLTVSSWNTALLELYNHYNMGNKTKTSYEIYSRDVQVVINYNQKTRQLFFSNDSCIWGSAYKNVSPDTLKTVAGLLLRPGREEFNKYFERDDLDSAKSGLITRACH
jgi:hypothetical protein